MQCAYCVYYTSAIVISFNPLWRHQIYFHRYCPFVRGNHTGVKVNSPHEGTVTRTFDVFVISLKKKLLNKHSIGRNFETPWRSFDVVVMHWIVSMVVAGGLTPIWCQDILNRRDEIGQLHIYRHAFFLSKLSRGISYFAEVATLPNARDFIFAFLWLHRCIVCNYCNAVYSRLVLFLLKRHRVSPVQVVTLYKPKTSCCFIKGTLYFGYA